MKIGPTGSPGVLAQSILGGRELQQQRRLGKKQQKWAGAKMGLDIGKAVADLGTSIAGLVIAAQRNALAEKELNETKRHREWIESGGLKMPEDFPQDANWQGPPPMVPVEEYRARSERRQAEAKAKEPSLSDTMITSLRAQKADTETKGMPLDLSEPYAKEIMSGVTGPATTRVQALKRAMAAIKSAYPSEKFGDYSPLSPEYSGIPEAERPQRVAQLARLVLGAGLSDEDRRAALDSIRAGMGNVDVGKFYEGLQQKIGAGKGWKQTGVLKIYPGGTVPQHADAYDFDLHNALHSQFPNVPELPWSEGKPPYPMPTGEERALAKALEDTGWYPGGILKPPPAQPTVRGNPLTAPVRGVVDWWKGMSVPPQKQR